VTAETPLLTPSGMFSRLEAPPPSRANPPSSIGAELDVADEGSP